MKRRLVKYLIVSIMTLFVLVPAASARVEWKVIYSNPSWYVPCDSVNGGVAYFHLEELIPADFSLHTIFHYYDPATGTSSYEDEFVPGPLEFTSETYWYVRPNGNFSISIELSDQGGLVHSSTVAGADCATGRIWTAFGSVYAPQLPKGFELRSLSCSSAVLDAPGGQQVGDNAVYAGQSWYVNPAPKAGPDGKNYTEIFVGGYVTGYIPTECIGGVP